MTAAPLPDETPTAAKSGDRMTGLTAFTQRRKSESRSQLFAAAVEVFRKKGYHSVSVDDIASAAGVSRMTFYRHFRSRADILGQIFERGSKAAMPRLTKIREEDFRDPAVVRCWMDKVFAADRSARQMLMAYSQALEIDREFAVGAEKFLRQLIDELGQAIPAFAFEDANDPKDRRRWLEGWLMIYEIFDHSNQAALEVGVADDPLILDILTSRFIAFVERYSPNN